MGRIVLANVPREEVLAFFGDRPLTAVTGKTPTTISHLTRQLDTDKANWLAWSVGFFEGSCGAAILNNSSQSVGAISVSGPQTAFGFGSEKRA